MSEVLTIFQTEILKVVGQLGEANISQIGKRTHSKLEKDCQFPGSFIARAVGELVDQENIENGFLERFVKIETLTGRDDDAVEVVYYRLTEKGKGYIFTTA